MMIKKKRLFAVLIPVLLIALILVGILIGFRMCKKAYPVSNEMRSVISEAKHIGDNYQSSAVSADEASDGLDDCLTRATGIFDAHDAQSGFDGLTLQNEKMATADIRMLANYVFLDDGSGKYNDKINDCLRSLDGYLK